MTNPETKSLRDWLCEEPFGLTMSSGFFSFFAHCGMLTVLEQEGLVPSSISGSSAGALVGGCWAAGLSAHDLSERLLTLKREDFWDPGIGAGLLRGQKFRQELRSLLPTATFSGCRVPLAVSLFDVLTRKTITATSGDLAIAIAGSCAFPLLFQPVRWHKRWVSDGGILDRPGLTGMDSDRVLYHHIESRSPWRRRNSPVLELPQQSGLVSLVIGDLPRVNPLKLEVGKLAFAKARDATKRALDQPISSNVVRI